MKKTSPLTQIIIFVSIALVIIAVGAFKNNEVKRPQKEEVTVIKPAEKLEVFYFHSTARCATCLAIGSYTKEVITENFSEYLSSGRLEFREVNVELSENKELAAKFQAQGSSLFINSIYDGTNHIEEDVQVWRLASNEEMFKKYLKGKLDALLAGQ